MKLDRRLGFSVEQREAIRQAVKSTTHMTFTMDALADLFESDDPTFDRTAFIEADPWSCACPRCGVERIYIWTMPLEVCETCQVEVYGKTWLFNGLAAYAASRNRQRAAENP